MWCLWSFYLYMIIITIINFLQFYVDTEFKITYSLTSSTHLPASFLSSSSGSIVTPTLIVTGGKWVQ